jgi:hypothetical protein
MAGVTESNNWSPEVYRFESEDVVEGGEDGLDNLPGKQLAGRTNWLRLMISAICAAEGVPVVNDETTQFLTALDSRIGNAISALVDSSPAALDTLNELAAALGDDPNFATTVTNALALKAPLASPALTGTPTAPTAPGGTNTTQLATTAFVQAAIAAIAAFTKASSAEILAGIDDTKYVTSKGLLAGLLGAGGTASIDYLTIPFRDKTDGSRKNLIIQWGILSGIALNETLQTVTFPLTYPTAVRNVQALIGLSAAISGNVSPYVKDITTSNFKVGGDHSTATATGDIYWLSIGY